MEQPLKGIKVLDLSLMWALPGTAMFLADQGADVIKVEPPAGDPGRTTFTLTPVGDVSQSFFVLNRNKRAIVVDIRKPEGKEIILKLAKDADIVMHNFRPGVDKRLGIDYESIYQINPRVIYFSITPWGPKGPLANNRAYDRLVQAISGIQGRRRLPDGTPLTAGVWVADCSAPGFMGYAIMLALFQREKTGQGQKVESSLLNCAIAIQSVDLIRVETEQEPPKYLADAATLNPYRCADNEWIIIIIVTNDEWGKLTSVMGIEHLVNHPHFNTPLARTENAAEMSQILEKIFLTKKRDEWVKLFHEHDVPSAPIINPEEVFTHPQIVENEMLVGVDQPGVGKVWMMNTPFKLSGSPKVGKRPAPAFGEHTEEVLRELGYSKEQMDELRQTGIIK
ncbi:MAG: CoA transferase [Candidatus Tectomicrobia bacterium]|uniref:CoA transferase n=1 Tax=Tectimicrobiota bacterium TaxID=2528274 RepID=A0A933LQN4_UNCTE|nr:CoA transferase [Candidatus Tectomicrobia bacterium]